MHATTHTRITPAARRLLLAVSLLLALSACQRSGETNVAREMTWAKAALERNPNLELVAADAEAGVLTVRDRRTGAISAVRTDELAAIPVAQITASVAGSAATVPVTAADESTAPEAPLQGAPAPDSEASAGMESPPHANVVGGDGYTIERHGSQVKVSGPGVSIVSGGSAPPVTARGEPGQRAVDPIICEGERMMHVDGRDIYVDGDAITVRKGCELYITNSRIVASATGVVVRQGTVHIANSYVEGSSASIDAQRDARLYVRGSTFQGMSRRDALARIDDQGGNRGLPTL